MDKALQSILEWLKRIQSDIDRLKTHEYTSQAAAPLWTPLTNGDPAAPELVFDPANGDVIMVAN